MQLKGKKTCSSYDKCTEPLRLVAFYDIRPGNGMGLFL